MAGVRILKPFGQEGLQLTHVLEGEVEGLKPRNGSLREVVAIHLTHGETHVPLRVPKFDPFLLEEL